MSLIMEFCVQQFWACRFTVSLCLLLLVRRREKRGEERWGDERRVEWYFLVILWRSCIHQFDRMIFWSSCGGVWIHQVLLYGGRDGADVRSYCRVRRWFGWRPNCCVSSVSPYLRLLRSAAPRNCVVSIYHSVQW